MHDLAKLIAERVASGLRRQSITSCSRWAEAYRVMGGKDFSGPWRFRYHPWLREMHDSTARMNIGQKSAQMGYTEAVLNRTFYKMDVERVDCLYVLPSKTPDASDFSTSRVNGAIDLSPHLTQMFSDAKNVGYKRAGAASLYIRGGKAESGLKSIPVGFLVLDEVDEMEDKAVSLAMERQSGQMTKEAWVISTPTVASYGINALFQTSTQEHFFFRCPCCSRHTELTFPDCIEITAETVTDPRIRDSFLKCKECGGKLPHETKTEWLSSAKWVPGYTDRDDRGFYINQMYSCTVSPSEFAKLWLKAQYNPTDEQEFWNSKMGIPHVVGDAQIKNEQIEACLRGHKQGPTNSGRLVTMGVDVGKWLHVEINEWVLPAHGVNDLNIESRPKTIGIVKRLHFEDLDVLMRDFRVNFAVVDANPERRKALEFANRFYGHVKLCFYGRGVSGKNIHVTKDEEEHGVTVDRTSWLDLSLGRVRSGRQDLPCDTPEEYKLHLKALVRRYEKDADGNPVGKYVKGNDDDHYAHARNYSEIALPFAAGLNVCQDIRESPV